MAARAAAPITRSDIRPIPRFSLSTFPRLKPQARACQMNPTVITMGNRRFIRMLGMKVMRQKITTRVRTTVGSRSLMVLRTFIFLKRTARAPAMARSSQKKVQSGAVM